MAGENIVELIRNELRDANKYLEGYNGACVDVYKHLVKLGYAEVAEKLRHDLDETFRHKYPIDWGDQ